MDHIFSLVFCFHSAWYLENWSSNLASMVYFSSCFWILQLWIRINMTCLLFRESDFYWFWNFLRLFSSLIQQMKPFFKTSARISCDIEGFPQVDFFFVHPLYEKSRTWLVMAVTISCSFYFMNRFCSLFSFLWIQQFSD